MPKFNMYQSLHTTVIGPQGKPVELQIRTHDMHRTADYGIAAHWKYKESARAGGKPRPGELGAPAKAGTPDDMLWLRQLLDWQREAQEPGEFLETLRYDLGPQEVFVFTPKGDVISLPGESRSEEHTSELQSRQYLVCRLLLEKKKKRSRHSRLFG